MPSSPVCVDASIVVRASLRVTGDPTTELLREWASNGAELVAPALLHYEATNALHRLVLGGHLEPSLARQVLRHILAMPMRLYDRDDLHLSAAEFAARFHLPATYDSHYLTLADQLGVEFWTADRKLANAVRPDLPWVHLVGG